MYFSIIAALIAASSAIDPARAALAARDSSASADVGVAAAPEGWVDIEVRHARRTLYAGYSYKIQG